jgi:hypothetical protein
VPVPDPGGSRAHRRTHRELAAGVVCGVLALSGATAADAATNPGETPARGKASNMGLCSAFLGQVGARADVNELLREFGPFLPDGPFDSPGELYRIRAQEHPNADAEDECLQRPRP